MYVIVKHQSSSGLCHVLTSFSLKGDGHANLPLLDYSVRFCTLPDVPDYLDEVPSAVQFEYLEQAYSFLAFLGLVCEEVLSYSILPIDL